MFKTKAAPLGVVFTLLLACGPAAAEPDLFSPQAFSGLLDIRAAFSDGQPSYLKGGFGRTRYGGDPAGDFKGQLSIADAALVWKPQLTWALGGVVDVEHQAGQENAVDLVQAYLTLKPSPSHGTRFAVRAGLFYPAISEEHEGPAWAVANSITPSAINSWIGEEVKVVGGEAKVTHAFGEHEVSATVGLFGYDDTSGTLLTFRGWGLTDIKATAFGGFKLPPIDPYMVHRQPAYTASTVELDGKVGYYGRLDWRPPGRFAFNAFYYDNRGDEVSVNSALQWSWATRFWNFGASFDIDDKTRILSQVLTGQTLMGYPNGRSVWINLGFTSAYVLATRSFGRSALTGRAEVFSTSDRNFRPATDGPEDNRGEHGWALTAAYRYALTPHAQLLLEAMHIRSRRPSLDEQGLEPLQSQALLQSSMRLSF